MRGCGCSWIGWVSSCYGGHSVEETPGSIPNPEAKPFSADGTALVTVWESRTQPDILSQRAHPIRMGSLSLRACRWWRSFSLDVRVRFEVPEGSCSQWLKSVAPVVALETAGGVKDERSVHVGAEVRAEARHRDAVSGSQETSTTASDGVGPDWRRRSRGFRILAFRTR